jgi:hypothetical protein
MPSQEDSGTLEVSQTYLSEAAIEEGTTYDVRSPHFSKCQILMDV